jgi:hypothetical protein
LHYQVLSKILASRYYSLHVTDRKLFKTLRLNPTFFLNIDDGVYQAVSGVEKCTESPNFLYIEYLIMDDSEDQ